MTQDCLHAKPKAQVSYQYANCLASVVIALIFSEMCGPIVIKCVVVHGQFINLLIKRHVTLGEAHILTPMP